MPWPPTYAYDEFSYYLTWALANPGSYDPNGDGKTSMEEAYLYSLAHDSRQLETLDGDGDNEGEHPSYYSDPWDLGRKISLKGYDGPVLPPRFGGYRQSQVCEAYPTGGVSQGWSGDDVSHSYTLPFSFPFFGQNYSTIYVSTNGLITFTASDNQLRQFGGWADRQESHRTALGRPFYFGHLHRRPPHFRHHPLGGRGLCRFTAGCLRRPSL